MDEILIEEKRYVSSKQAAKITGYAKDYIGQLCREGRVPARLVGRSWYVLEAAIHDHRFGNSKNEPTEMIQPAAATWESPRYEASESEVLPSIQGSQDEEPLDSGNNPEVAQRLQETWQAWFDRFEASAPEKPTIDAVAPEKPEMPEEETKEQEMEQEGEQINIPIHTVYQSHYQIPPEELLPRRSEEVEEEQPVIIEAPRKRRGFTKMLQVAGAVVAMAMVSLAVLGSGYLDSYLVSHSQVGLIAGVELYNK
ncbi:MAG: helix-turn-helix domain-containing protein [Minisyncoccia bacterium]